MTGALLSEVWPDMVEKPKKAKKQKKKPKMDQVIQPLTPQEMETELLEDNGKEIIEAYVSRNISKCPVTTLKKYIDILQIICNSLHPKKYFILYNISKELFTIFNTMVFKAFLL